MKINKNISHLIERVEDSKYSADNINRRNNNMRKNIYIVQWETSCIYYLDELKQNVIIYNLSTPYIVMY